MPKKENVTEVYVNSETRDALVEVYKLATIGAHYININRGCVKMKPNPYDKPLELVKNLLNRQLITEI